MPGAATDHLVRRRPTASKGSYIGSGTVRRIMRAPRRDGSGAGRKLLGPSIVRRHRIQHYGHPWAGRYPRSGLLAVGAERHHGMDSRNRRVLGAVGGRIGNRHASDWVDPAHGARSRHQTPTPRSRCPVHWNLRGTAGPLPLSSPAERFLGGPLLRWERPPVCWASPDCPQPVASAPQKPGSSLRRLKVSAERITAEAIGGSQPRECAVGNVGPLGRPPLLPRRLRLTRWSLGSGMVCLIRRLRR